MASSRNVGREIALSLLAAVVLVNGSDVHLLVVSLVGVPVLDGISAAIKAGGRMHPR